MISIHYKDVSTSLRSIFQADLSPTSIELIDLELNVLKIHYLIKSLFKVYNLDYNNPQNCIELSSNVYRDLRSKEMYYILNYIFSTFKEYSDLGVRII